MTTPAQVYANRTHTYLGPDGQWRLVLRSGEKVVVTDIVRELLTEQPVESYTFGGGNFTSLRKRRTQ